MPDHQAGILLPFRRNTGYDSVEHKAGNQAAARGKEQGGAEAALKYLFVFAINAIPEVRKGIESNYGKELEQTLMQGTYELFESIVEEENLYQNYSRQELKLILRYHSYAIFGIFQDWTPEDTKNLDMIVHEVYLIMMGKNATEDVFLC